MLVDLEPSRAPGCEASRAWVIRHLASLPSLSIQREERNSLQTQRLMISVTLLPSVVSDCFGFCAVVALFTIISVISQKTLALSSLC